MSGSSSMKMPTLAHRAVNRPLAPIGRLERRQYRGCTSRHYRLLVMPARHRRQGIFATRWRSDASDASFLYHARENYLCNV